MIPPDSRLPLPLLDRFWADALGCAPADLRGGQPRLVPCGQRQLQVLATPDGAALIGLPEQLQRAAGAQPGQLLDPTFWAARFGVAPAQLTFYGPGLLAYATAQSFVPHPNPAVQRLQRADAAELARFARILQAREPTIFHSWAIGGRVAANEWLWGAVVDGKIVSVAGLRRIAKNLCEVGINTLPHHRQQGWGRAVASAATEAGLALAPLVQWSAPLANEPSRRIAQRLGFLPYAHQLWLTPP